MQKALKVLCVILVIILMVEIPVIIYVKKNKPTAGERRKEAIEKLATENPVDISTPEPMPVPEEVPVPEDIAVPEESSDVESILENDETDFADAAEHEGWTPIGEFDFWRDVTEFEANSVTQVCCKAEIEVYMTDNGTPVEGEIYLDGYTCMEAGTWSVVAYIPALERKLYVSYNAMTSEYNISEYV